MDNDRGDTLFKEKLLECYQPGGGGWESNRKNILKVYGLRGINFLIIILFIDIVWNQYRNDDYEAVTVFCDVLTLIGIVIVLLLSENAYMHENVSSRQISIYSNGLIIPPIYFRALSKERGFIRKDRIDHIEVRWHKEHTAYFSKVSSIVWYDAPVEFIVHLKGGKTISSGKRPPETILEAVEMMGKAWGIKINRQGFKNGRMERIVDLETVEEREL